MFRRVKSERPSSEPGYLSWEPRRGDGVRKPQNADGGGDKGVPRGRRRLRPTEPRASDARQRYRTTLWLHASLNASPVKRAEKSDRGKHRLPCRIWPALHNAMSNNIAARMPCGAGRARARKR